MPWEKTDVGEQRIKFVIQAVSGKEQMAALCREFGISRPTGYRWRKKFEHAGSITGVQEKSRRPAYSPRQTEAAKEERVVALRHEYGWGAKSWQCFCRKRAAR
jgi:transposase-like protein